MYAQAGAHIRYLYVYMCVFVRLYVVDALYHAMSECSKLNPDSDLSEGEGDFLYNADEIQFGSGVTDETGDYEYGEGGDDGGVAYGGSSNEARLAQLAMHMGMNAADRFADAEEGEDADEDESESLEEEEIPRAKGQLADGHAELNAAARQVHSVGSNARPKRERYQEEQTSNEVRRM
jgi:hypothetical protein